MLYSSKDNIFGKNQDDSDNMDQLDLEPVRERNEELSYSQQQILLSQQTVPNDSELNAKVFTFDELDELEILKQKYPEQFE